MKIWICAIKVSTHPALTDHCMHAMLEMVPRTN